MCFDWMCDDGVNLQAKNGESIEKIYSFLINLIQFARK